MSDATVLGQGRHTTDPPGPDEQQRDSAWSQRKSASGGGLEEPTLGHVPAMAEHHATTLRVSHGLHEPKWEQMEPCQRHTSGGSYHTRLTQAQQRTQQKRPEMNRPLTPGRSQPRCPYRKAIRPTRPQAHHTLARCLPTPPFQSLHSARPAPSWDPSVATIPMQRETCHTCDDQLGPQVGKRVLTSGLSQGNTVRVTPPTGAQLLSTSKSRGCQRTWAARRAGPEAEARAPAARPRVGGGSGTHSLPHAYLCRT